MLAAAARRRRTGVDTLSVHSPRHSVYVLYLNVISYNFELKVRRAPPLRGVLFFRDLLA
jgi:hypothetical protein